MGFSNSCQCSLNYCNPLLTFNILVFIDFCVFFFSLLIVVIVHYAAVAVIMTGRSMYLVLICQISHSLLCFWEEIALIMWSGAGERTLNPRGCIEETILVSLNPYFISLYLHLDHNFWNFLYSELKLYIYISQCHNFIILLLYAHFINYWIWLDIFYLFSIYVFTGISYLFYFLIPPSSSQGLLFVLRDKS